MNRSIRHRQCIAFLFISLCAVLFRPAGAFCSQYPPLTPQRHSPSLEYINEDFSVQGPFQSHLPVLVFTFPAYNAAPAALSVELSLHGKLSGENFPLHAPQATHAVVMKEEPDQGTTNKKTYTLALEDGAAGVSLAGLPSDTQWRLQGSTRDKSMLRNGLAYALSRELDPAITPQTQFCEVLFNKDGLLQYQGVYILAQHLEHLLEPLAGEAGAKAAFTYSPAKDKKRNPDQQSDGALWGYSLSERGFSPLFSDHAKAVGQELLLESTLGSLERSFGSLKPEEFLAYAELLNSESIYNLFILNSLMLHSPTPGVPFAFYQNVDGRLNAMPIWNFDVALDNAPERLRPLPFDDEVTVAPAPALLDRMIPVWRTLADGATFQDLAVYHLYKALEGQEYLWFEHLFLSKPFLDGLYSYYHKLRRGPLAPEKVDALVAAQTEYLGPALERDWFRWEKDYAATKGDFALQPYTDSKNKVHLRQTGTLGDELVKIRHCLRQQNSFLFENVGRIEWMTVDLFDNSTTGNRQAAYAIAMVISFLALSHIVTRQL